MKAEEEIKYGKKLEKDEEREKTGKWKIFIPRIDLKKCDKNYRCFIVCPHDAIDIRKDGFPSIDATKCTGCLICLRECQPQAISEERE